MRAAIPRFCPNIYEVAYKSKRTQIYSWKKAHQKLRVATQANNGGHRKIRGKGTETLLSNELENEIVRFVNELRKEGVPVSIAMLTIQAKKVAAEAAVSPFSASGCSVNGFNPRHRMSVRAPARQGQQSPADLDKIATGFAAHVEEIVRHLGINRI
uniref:Uncharacterized protein AlNc14C1358G12907 n=1 Tax=Albugo laibachii Nc14 TaxID=890382 RepID=F0X2N9_9STRA|nr:conserved hypothetical protein [Albugo laibachii Nc14]|eukprot:CCA28160.1 conserved hypothetical protein [Albugo laibachii Nc14]